MLLEYGSKLYDDVENGLFKILTPKEIAIETLELLKNLDSEACIFRSNHASNYLSLKGTLNKDKDKMIDILKEAIKTEKAYKSRNVGDGRLCDKNVGDGRLCGNSLNA